MDADLMIQRGDIRADYADAFRALDSMGGAVRARRALLDLLRAISSDHRWDLEIRLWYMAFVLDHTSWMHGHMPSDGN